MIIKKNNKRFCAGLALALLIVSQANVIAKAKANPNFTEDVAQIVFNNCMECHRSGQAAPFALTNYNNVKKRAKLIVDVTESRYMPPWHPVKGHGKFLDERRLTEDELATLKNWYKSGMAEGPADKMPTPPKFESDWMLGEPDLIVTMPKAYTVAADGPDIYRSFVIPLDLKEDKWIAGFEVRPGARSVLHHVLIRLDETGEARKADGARGVPGFSGMRGIGRGRGRSSDLFSGSLGGLGGWAVGGTPRILPLGLARHLPAGSDLVLNSHFHPSGKEESEKTTIGFYFAKKKPDRTLIGFQVPPLFGSISGLDIPAGEKEYTLTSSFTTPVDIDVIGVGAHMHYLGRTAKATATFPDGTTKSLFYINDWDFNWQNNYFYQNPVRLPAGTKINGVVTFDNSENNPHNPSNPPRRVKWGLESSDEMGSVNFTAVPASEGDLNQFKDSVRNQFVEEARKMADRRFSSQSGSRFRDGEASNRLRSRSENTSRKRSKLGGDWRSKLGSRLKGLDKNKNGEIEANEIDEQSKRFIRFIDTNKDGKVSREELSRLNN